MSRGDQPRSASPRTTHILRYPDKPTYAPRSRLKGLREGEWLCQVKMDGWRALVGWDGNALGLVTRNFNPIQCSKELRRELTRLFSGVEQLTILDAEWLLPEGVPVFEERLSTGPERLVIFDMLAEDGAWIGDQPAGERFKRLGRFWKQHGKRMRRIELVACTTRNYEHAFLATREHPGAEGVVLKHFESKYIGSTESSTVNPKWLKVKWPAIKHSQQS